MNSILSRASEVSEPAAHSAQVRSSSGIASLVRKVCWMLSLLAAALAGWMGATDISDAESAPQQAAAAAIALLFAIVPYLSARSLDELTR